MLDQLNVSGQVRELARNSELKHREGDHWTFKIAPALTHLGSQNCVARLEQAVAELLGHPVRIQLGDGSAARLQTAAEADHRRAQQTMSEAERSIKEDPTVKDLKERMGARIIDDSIQPIQ